jgi:hypothetical protein
MVVANAKLAVPMEKERRTGPRERSGVTVAAMANRKGG